MDPTGPIAREWTFISSVVRTLRITHAVGPDTRLTAADWLERHARMTPDAPALLHRGRVVNYREFEEGANRYARWALSQRVSKGEAVALLMENRPEYLMAWFGLVKTGAIAALINTHLTGHPLAHEIGLAEAKHLILDAGLAQNFFAVSKMLSQPPKVWATGGRVSGAEDLDSVLASHSGAAVNREVRDAVRSKDRALYIYTSGTTGLPKAANLSHMRVLHIMAAFQGAVNAKPSDRMYNVLPLYHSAGGICALGPILLGGGSMVIREKFAATEFWDDCYDYRPTLFQYIGELCRYLLNAPEHPREREHNLRIAIGNGLRPEIWPRFKERFGIPRVMEFYGATEGNVGMINYDGKVGAVGRVPWYAREIQKIRLVRYDINSGNVARGADGLCIETDDGEAGEAVGKIDPSVARLRFDGYTAKEETEKKILRDVFKKDDAWFRTHDLMCRDRHGYFYFVDRTGDTFRWKSENVATSEVAEALSVFPGIREANVYGVVVPGEEGKAGMAAIVAALDLDLDALSRHLEKNLPSYARPIFLRIQKEIAATSTFKQLKIGQANEGFDPAAIKDPIYVWDREAGRYRKLDAELHSAIVSGHMRF
ncbi:MAG: long-chain-acyl-CoA synthetase [Alphaproteobacteria bacterium]